MVRVGLCPTPRKGPRPLDPVTGVAGGGRIAAAGLDRFEQPGTAGRITVEPLDLVAFLIVPEAVRAGTLRCLGCLVAQPARDFLDHVEAHQPGEIGGGRALEQPEGVSGICIYSGEPAQFQVIFSVAY